LKKGKRGGGGGLATCGKSKAVADESMRAFNEQGFRRFNRRTEKEFKNNNEEEIKENWLRWAKGNANVSGKPEKKPLKETPYAGMGVQRSKGK